ncbi:N(6)-L-threonylcarbamoyladenine synthase, TsaE subunit [Gammaproteobacteria bacterium]
MEITIKTASAMQKLGAAIARVCEPDCTIYLRGELGAGKTTLVRGFLHELGHQGHVRSPTFTLLEPYQFDAYLVYHFDLYRLINAEEFAYIGGRDYFTEQSICLIEWPECGRGFLPAADLICNFDFAAKGKWRRVQLVSGSDKGKNIIGKLNNDNA